MTRKITTSEGFIPGIRRMRPGRIGGVAAARHPALHRQEQAPAAAPSRPAGPSPTPASARRGPAPAAPPGPGWSATGSGRRPGRPCWPPRCSAACTEGSDRAAAMYSTMPIGTFTRNTGRQDQPNRFAVTSTPPSTCPTTIPQASTAVQALIALARASPWKVCWIRLSTCGSITRRGHALDHPEDDQLAGALGQAAGQRGEGEAGQAGLEQPLVAQDAAQARAGHQQDGVGDDVAGGDHLQAGAGGVQLLVDARQGDVDDGAVQQRHEVADQDGGQDQRPTGGCRPGRSAAPAVRCPSWRA